MTSALRLVALVALAGAPAARPAARPAGSGDPPLLLAGELLAPGPRLAPSARARALDGQRVRLAGYMAELEEPPRGAFYLSPRPVRCDEGGAGTGDLPPDAVRVVVRAAPGAVLPHVPGPIVATGVLVIGNAADADGRVSLFRLVLERPPEARSAPPPAPARP